MNAKSIATVTFVAAIIGGILATLLFGESDKALIVAAALFTCMFGVAITVALVATKRRREPR
jgi:hypothetical protein